MNWEGWFEGVAILLGVIYIVMPKRERMPTFAAVAMMATVVTVYLWRTS